MTTRGRKTDLTPEVQEKICNAIGAGNYANTAAEYAGIGERTYYRWMALGEKAKSGIYRQFWQAIKKAEADAEAGRVMTVFSAAMGGQQIANKHVTKTTTRPDGSIVEESRNEVAFSQPNWTAAAWWLERKFPERWGRKDALTVKTWQDEIIALLRGNQLTYEDVKAELGDEHATKLALAAGISIRTSREAESESVGAEAPDARVTGAAD